MFIVNFVGLWKSSEGNAEKSNTKLTSHLKDIRLFFVVQAKTTGTKASNTNAIEFNDIEED